MKKSILIFVLSILVLTLFATIAASIQPQLTTDEQNMIVESVIQTINPQGMIDSIVSTVEARVLVQSSGASEATATPAGTSSTTEPVAGATGTTPEGPFTGIHAKFSNSYAYTVGGDNGDQVTVESEYTPNTLFNIDVVFENDGDTVWPALVEMRNVSTAGTYTGHSPNVIVDTTYAPVIPGGKRAFTIAAHGSEDLGYHTFYFQLYDAVSGSLLAGGSGSFSYLAK